MSPELFSFAKKTTHLQTWHAAKTLSVHTRDATFRKMTNQNQANTDETATKETKNQTYFILPKKYQYLTKF